MKEKLIRKIHHYNDEAPILILRGMKVAELKQYLQDLRTEHPDLVKTEPD